jgi:hypothetical protein
MTCGYCGKDFQQSNRAYSELREIIRSKDSTSSLHINELYRVSKIFFPNYPSVMDICIDCEYEIAKDPNKFILKQRLLR